MLKSVFAGAALAALACADTPRASASPYYSAGSSRLQETLRSSPIIGPAKNAILLLGDGMSIETGTAARIRKGQLAGGGGRSCPPACGEESLLSWEAFDAVGLSKTYNDNQQVPDSAGTITAVLTGVKTKAGLIGINASSDRARCASSIGNSISTLAEWAKSRGVGVGIVSTARVTHATPAGMYGHTPERDWEADVDIPDQDTAAGCKDLALQLIDWEVGGASWDVVLGGGRRNFLPNSTAEGVRADGRDLVAEWLANTSDGSYVRNTEELAATRKTPVLGLFNADHMSYEHDRDTTPTGEPSIAAMTKAAIQLLGDVTKFPKGYLLLVEGARIDHAHHDGNWFRALSETLAMDDAVAFARNSTSLQDTLVVVTADHAHTTTMGGYATRGNDILGEVVLNDNHGASEGIPARGDDNSTYTTLGYYNGPGGQTRTPRSTIEGSDAPDYLQQSNVPLESETHGGQDVGVWASGPDAHLLNGHFEQNYIFFVFLHALQLESTGLQPQTGGSGIDNVIIIASVAGGILIAVAIAVVAVRARRQNAKLNELSSIRGMGGRNYASDSDVLIR